MKTFLDRLAQAIVWATGIIFCGCFLGFGTAIVMDIADDTGWKTVIVTALIGVSFLAVVSWAMCRLEL